MCGGRRYGRRMTEHEAFAVELAHAAAAETLSLSARLARPVADAWLTQWSHLARETGPEYWGAMV